jgi:hypothetical protein
MKDLFQKCYGRADPAAGADNCEAHRSHTTVGAGLFIVD